MGDVEELIGRLRKEVVLKQYPSITLIIEGKETTCDGGQVVMLRNPDGPEAVNALTSLQDRLAAVEQERDGARKALDYLMSDPAVPAIALDRTRQLMQHYKEQPHG